MSEYDSWTTNCLVMNYQGAKNKLGQCRDTIKELEAEQKSLRELYEGRIRRIRRMSEYDEINIDRLIINYQNNNYELNNRRLNVEQLEIRNRSLKKEIFKRMDQELETFTREIT